MINLTSIDVERDLFSPEANLRMWGKLTFEGTITPEAYAYLWKNKNGIRFELPEGLTENKKPQFGGAFRFKGDMIYITRVLYNNPATIVFWSDKTKTVSKCAEGDTYSAELGLTMAILKKIAGDDSVRRTLADWLPADETVKAVDIKDLRQKRYKAQKEAKKLAKQATEIKK